MKTSRSFLFTLLVAFVAMVLISACGARNKWITFRVNEPPPNSNLLPYSFQYPPDWVGYYENNNITFASDEALLMDITDKLKPGQIIVNINANVDMPPEELVETSASSLTGVIEFDETVLYDLNNRPAAYLEGINPETGDQVIFIAVDMGKNMRGLVLSRVAEGELAQWKKTLMKVAESFQVKGDG
jgi:hypothetical protein